MFVRQNKIRHMSSCMGKEKSFILNSKKNAYRQNAQTTIMGLDLLMSESILKNAKKSK